MGSGSGGEARSRGRGARGRARSAHQGTQDAGESQPTYLRGRRLASARRAPRNRIPFLFQRSPLLGGKRARVRPSAAPRHVVNQGKGKKKLLLLHVRFEEGTNPKPIDKVRMSASCSVQ